MESRCSIAAFALLAQTTAQVPTAAVPAVTPAATSALATDALIVRGRVVHADTGVPLPRCSVQLSGHQCTGYDLAWAAGDWANPPAQTTGADGVFEFRLRMAAPHEAIDRNRYHLDITHPHHLAWFSQGTFHAGRRLGTIDYGDIRLPAGVRPRLRCVDTDGKLQAGVQVLLRGVDEVPAGPPGPAGTESAPRRSAYGVTDIDGHMHFDHPLANGRYTISVRNRTAHSLPDVVQLPGAGPVEIVVAALPVDRAIEGRVVDDTGLPVAGATLAVGGDAGPSCVSRRDGGFTLLRRDQDAAGPARIQLARNRRYDDWVEVAVHDWGTRDASIELPRQQRVTFVVTDADGVPCEAFNLVCLPVAAGSAHGGVRLAGQFAAGRATTPIEPGTYEVRTHPLTDRLLPSIGEQIQIDVPDAVIPIRLERAAERTVELVFAGTPDAPAADVLVEVIDGGEPGPFEFVPPATRLPDSHRRAAAKTVSAAARSDARGVAVLHLGQPGPAHVRCSGPGTLVRVQQVDLRPDRPLRIVVDRGARLSGTLGPIAVLPQLDPDHAEMQHVAMYRYSSLVAPTLTLVLAGDGGSREGIRLDADGRFSCTGIPSGEIEVRLQTWRRAGAEAFRNPPRVLGRFRVEAGTERSVELQVPDDLHGK